MTKFEYSFLTDGRLCPPNPRGTILGGRTSRDLHDVLQFEDEDGPLSHDGKGIDLTLRVEVPNVARSTYVGMYGLRV